VVPDRCPLARWLSNARVDTIYCRPISLGNESVKQAAAAAADHDSCSPILAIEGVAWRRPTAI